MGEIRIGCSGWSYDDWVGSFYPPGTEPAQMFGAYVQSFDTVEVNSTFYRIPNQWICLLYTSPSPRD